MAVAGRTGWGDIKHQRDWAPPQYGLVPEMLAWGSDPTDPELVATRRTRPVLKLNLDHFSLWTGRRFVGQRCHHLAGGHIVTSPVEDQACVPSS